MLVSCRHDQGAERPHFLVEEADGVILGIVGPEAVGTDHFGQTVALMRRRRITAATHFAEADGNPGLGQLPRRFGPGEAAADDMHLISHGARLGGGLCMCKCDCSRSATKASPSP